MACYKFLCIFLCCLFCGCSSIAIQQQTTFFQQQHIQPQWHDALAQYAIGDTIHLKGIVNQTDFAHPAPCLLFISANKQISFALLDSTNQTIGTQISVTGVVNKSAQQAGMLTLSPISILQENNWQAFILRSNNYYKKHVKKFSTHFDVKNWHLINYKNFLIVFSQQASVLSTRQMNFVYNHPDEKLAYIYWQQQFKGE